MMRYALLLAVVVAAIPVCLCVDNCLTSRDVYASRGIGPSEDVPVEFISGAVLSICVRSAITCCSHRAEVAFDDTTYYVITNSTPQYGTFLDVSQTYLQPHYVYVTDIVIPSFIGYLNLTLPNANDDIQSVLTVIRRQLNTKQIRNGGRSFLSTIRRLFSYLYLERMRGIYDLGASTNYADDFLTCARNAIEDQLPDEVIKAMKLIDFHFQAAYRIRQIYYSMTTLFIHLETGFPFRECQRSYAELFFCQICKPETATVSPCRNVCKNILTGCSIFLNIIGEHLDPGLRLLNQLDDVLRQDSMGMRNALQVLDKHLNAVYETSTEALLSMASEVSSLCNETTPGIASDPSPMENPVLTTEGAMELLAKIPSSLTQDLHSILVTNLTDMFARFNNITERILESQCGSFPVDDGLDPDFECWRRDRPESRDIAFLGIDYDRAVFDNADMEPPSTEFVLEFNTLVGYLGANFTEVEDFVRNIPDGVTVISTTEATLPPLTTEAPGGGAALLLHGTNRLISLGLVLLALALLS